MKATDRANQISRLAMNMPMFQKMDAGTTRQEFAATTAATDTSSTGLTDSQVQKWLAKIIDYGALQMKFNQSPVIIQNTEMLDKNTETVTIMKETSKLNITTTNPGEAYTGIDNRTATEITNLDTVDIAINNSTDWKMGFIAVSHQMMVTNIVDLMAYARKALAYAYAVDIEESICTELQSTSVTNIVWGGDATAVETITAGDLFTVDHIAEMKQKIKANNFVPKFIYITSFGILALEKSSSFTNAAEYGGREVILNGEFGKYLDIKIIETENSKMIYAEDATDLNETADTWDLAAGHVAIMIGVNRSGTPTSVAISWKMKPRIDYRFIVDSLTHRFFSTMAYTVDLVQAASICLGKFSQA